MASLAVSRDWVITACPGTKALGLAKVLVFTVDKVPHRYGNVCRAKRENENGPSGREAQHFSPTFSLVASIPANHRDQNSRAN